jgi:triacylglycerol lipase
MNSGCDERLYVVGRQTMSFLTQLPINLYAADAFDDFHPILTFHLGTARALAWLSQLAYETDQSKINQLCQMLNLSPVGNQIVESVTTALPIADTKVLVLGFGGATLIAFAGTDPVSLVDWVSDFDIRPTDGGAAEGFDTAMRAVEFDILSRLAPDGQIFVTGHSLGGALAVLLADQLNTMGKSVAAVYTFGMPRPGRRTFADRYNADPLANRTYRLVYGEDIVPTVAPSEPFGFRHVGQYLPVVRSEKFSASPNPDLSSDQPEFVRGVAKEFANLFHGSAAAFAARAAQMQAVGNALIGSPTSIARSDLGGIFIELLPTRIRDHMPDRYIAACSP